MFVGVKVKEPCSFKINDPCAGPDMRLEIRGFSRHTDFCGLAIRGPGAFENFYAN
jgi:hypothetical protein